MNVFGPLVLGGVLLGRQVVFRRAARVGIPRSWVDEATVFALAFGFVSAHLAAVFFYSPQRIEREGLGVLLKLWDGWSSYGGLFGALLGLAVFKLRFRKPLLPLLDCLAQGLVVGWVFGRLGCTLVFDHPGIRTDFFLAFRHSTGLRHNLGFYEALYTVCVLVPVSFWLDRRKLAQTGLQCAVLGLLYAPMRFFLDFLRADVSEGGDLRWLWGLTWAQGCCGLLGLVCLLLVIRIRQKKA